MISAIRIVLTAYTASFRVPSFVGHQLTLPVPPLSTIYGLLSAAAGRWILPTEVEWLAYRCEYEGKAVDLEAIITVERSKPTEAARLVGRNVLQREFLVMPRLALYLPPEWEAAFRKPRYPLLLGRTQDVAGVDSITPVTLEPVDEGEVSGVLLPLELVADSQNRVGAWLHNLPLAFTAEPYRKLLGMKIFGVVDVRHRPAFVRAFGWLVRDTTGGTVVPLYRREWVTKNLNVAL
ncbi:type I-B CRISPR-associated protein Cas5b [Desulfovirgula thermocuniculi]|uniref:type I-B CRISPR-associated protein Cas5b n=1 Tax=Desulfovirgula thermocuniculi TaxID=348842 RepID=UPI00146FBD3E|nr:type I-B CRISPR-associated protein Cas5b [Desulfovirgula thermocuniculi]